MEKYRKQLAKYTDIPEEVMKVIDAEMEKLSTLEMNSSEYNVTRMYLDWLCGVPWGVQSEENFDIGDAKKILDRDHYGLDDVKDIILEFIAVGKLKGSVQGKIVCLAGPPGTGKVRILVFRDAFFAIVSKLTLLNDIDKYCQICCGRTRT
jgi:Lon-like ATP-dependent protease